jgi:hypothetical protein
MDQAFGGGYHSSIAVRATVPWTRGVLLAGGSSHHAYDSVGVLQHFAFFPEFCKQKTKKSRKFRVFPVDGHAASGILDGFDWLTGSEGTPKTTRPPAQNLSPLQKARGYATVSS